jgi:hypothetical protein
MARAIRPTTVRTSPKANEHRDTGKQCRAGLSSAASNAATTAQLEPHRSAIRVSFSPQPPQAAAQASAQPDQQTFAQVLIVAGLKPPAGTVRDLGHAITSYAALDDRDYYLIAYYWNLPSGMLEDPLRVLSIDKQTGEWKSAQVMLDGQQMGHGECVGSVLRAHALGRANTHSPL